MKQIVMITIGIALILGGCESTSGIRTSSFQNAWLFCGKNYRDQWANCMRWQNSYASFSSHQKALINDIATVELAYKRGDITKEQSFYYIELFTQHYQNQAVREARNTNCRTTSALATLGRGIGSMASSSSTTLGGAVVDGFAGAGSNRSSC